MRLKDMTIERAHANARPKPWGVADLRPWSEGQYGGGPIGELWYERPDGADAESSLLLKILFTSQPLSIQVHPDDAYARSIGLPRGKTEAWYILSAAPQSKVALGLSRHLTAEQLREALDDGSIADLVVWQGVAQGDVILVPAGTIHSIGADLVIAEIQQRSDATFRLFDHGSARELHIESAITAADTGPASLQVQPRRLTDERTLLVSNPHFVLERLDLAPGSAWQQEAERETWLLVLSGSARIGSFEVGRGEAIFAQSDRIDIRPGPAGMVALAAYTGPGPVANLLRPLRRVHSQDAERRPGEPVPTSLAHASKEPTSGRLEISR
jgi:mannose-6-phosphate isomerase